MAAANSNIQLAGLDFNDIKNNFITYLSGQDTFKDYNFEGSGMQVLLDVLAYNTQYNAFYLNMVANEMFLDTAVQRSSVVSHAKTLNYTPKSAASPTATINLILTNVTANSLTLPAYTTFLSESVNGINYKFATTTSQTISVDNGTATFNNVQIKQGIPTSYAYTVNSTSNPSYVFQIPDNNIDTSTLVVTVRQSSSNSYYEVYNNATDYLTLDNNSLVYFVNEALNGNYEISFGDGILGKKLSDGNIVVLSYLVTQGTAAAGANNFVLTSNVFGGSSAFITGLTPATQGGEKESIDSIKYQAPKSYAAQGRAVTKEDYITVIQQNKLGYDFDAVNVWGGEQNDPPVYGQVFIALKPKNSYTLTTIQKNQLIKNVIKPISVMTVEPIIVDTDYTYLKLNINVVCDSKKTTLDSGNISALVKSAVTTFTTNTLNTFNSTFSVSDLSAAISSANPSIIANEISVQLQKKIYPTFKAPNTYKLYYGAPIKKGTFLNGVSSSPSFTISSTLSSTGFVSGVYFEEIPTDAGGITGISVLNPGFGYQSAPSVTIVGDGTGATAEVIIVNGSIQKINMLTIGSGYTSAYVVITPAEFDTSGQGAAANPILTGNLGTLRTYYNDANRVKTIINSNAGTIDYTNGIVTLTAFTPTQIDNSQGQLTVSAYPQSTIISSQYNRIITLDNFDSNAITVTVSAK
jgi:hypothetical protein